MVYKNKKQRRTTFYFLPPIIVYYSIYIMLSLTNLKKPIYTNNSLVFYKRGSLASGGVSTVANSRVKARRT